MGVLDQAAGQTQRKAAFGVDLLLQQHAPHVGVLDDLHLWRKRVLVAGQAPLRPLAGVGQRMQVTLVRQAGGA
ncbi:hypothetical protein D3C86_1827560 [compost metagenome]